MASMYIVDMSKERNLLLCNTAFVYVEDESMFSGNLHEVVESDIVLLEILSMDAEVIGYSNYTCALFQDLVNLLLSWLQTSPGGRQQNQYWPNGELKVMSSCDASSSSTQ